MDIELLSWITAFSRPSPPENRAGSLGTILNRLFDYVFILVDIGGYPGIWIVGHILAATHRVVQRRHIGIDVLIEILWCDLRLREIPVMLNSLTCRNFTAAMTAVRH